MAAKKTRKPAAKPEASNVVRLDDRRKKNRRKSRHTGEIIAICAIASAILLGISIYAGGGGIAGQAVNGVFRGLFGFGALLLPAAAAGLGVMMALNKFKTPGGGKTAMAAGLFLCVISLAHVLTQGKPILHDGFPAYITYCFRMGSFINGGVFGALIGDALLKILGVAGTYIAILTSAMVLGILLTDRSIIQGLRMGISKARDMRLAREEYEEDSEEPEEPIRRAERVVPGITELRPRDPKKATVTIDERASVERPKILIFNEGEEPPKPRPERYIETAKDEPYDEEYTETRKEEYTEARKEEYTEARKEEYDFEPPFDDYGYIPEDEPFDIEPPVLEPAIKEPSETVLSVMEPPPDMELLKERLSFNRKQEKKPQKPISNEHIQYKFPPIELLNRNTENAGKRGRAQILENSRKLEDTLKSFGVDAKVIEVSKGPAVTRYELSPGPGVKVSKIAGLADDLALNLAAVGIRIEAPIPGKAAVGIEIPNKEVTTVFLREVIEDERFEGFPSKLAFALGKDIAGNAVVADIARMPHLLIAGATGSGKSVCVNTLVTSILYKADPNEVKLVMVDPKVVELSVYNGIPHLLIPVVTDPRKAAGALNWAVQEMINRYNMFAETSVRDLKGYNVIARERGEEQLPQIVIIIDELADLMMAAPSEVEDAICRLAQMARAAGLHLIIATQRPSVDVITGLIKANIPSRLAFAVSSGVDSRTVLDTVGAEKLLGKGDMLFYPVGVSKPQRVQGAFITDKEVENIVAFVKNNSVGVYDQEMIDKITSAKTVAENTGEVDELFIFAAEFVIEKDKASASMLQRQFRIGYNKAARLIEELENHGIVGPEDGSKPRKVLMNSFQWAEYKESL